MRRSAWFAVAAFRGLCVALLVTAMAAQALADVPRGAKEEMVSMRDGVKLATNVYVPKGDGPFPVVVMRTPYGKDAGLSLGSDRYLKAGYAYVAQDCRGRFRSEGEYQPFETDREDGFDTIAWVAKQPWCNGKVGMTGASAMGITSLLAATAQPEALKCCYVIVAPDSFWTCATFIGGVFKEADTTGWLKSQGAEHRIPERRASLADSKLELAKDIAVFRDQIKVPIYHVGGWYDIFSVGTQNNFSFLHNEGAEGARGQQKLLMGPFGHGALKGELNYASGGSILGALADEIRWFDFHLKGVDNGIGTEPRVKYYQMASARKKAASEKNGWRLADNWPVAAEPTKFYLHSNRTLSRQAPTESNAATTYQADPAKPVPTVGGANLTIPLGPLDQREIAPRPDYLRFESPVLDADVTVVGRVYLDLVASTDGPDTDFMVKLIDIYPDGYEALILDQPLRTRYRNGHRPEKVQMMTPGEPTRMTVELGGTANTFEAGHRIAVHIASSNYPRFEVNPNTGEAPGQNTKPPRVAENKIHHDESHPTALVLPVVE